MRNAYTVLDLSV